MAREHHYSLSVIWTGNLGTGTSGYREYSRNHEIRSDGKPPLPGSSDPHFRGDKTRYNPEELLVASLSSCHMLWFLHFCAEAGVVVTDYCDAPVGTMAENPDGSGEFREVVLHPQVVVTDAARIPELAALHDRAHHMCFIARSVNFPVTVEPVE